MSTVTDVDNDVSRHIGRYSDAVRVPADHDLVVLSGTPGLRADGTPPAEFAAEARQAWTNVAGALTRAGARLTDIVSVRTWLTSADDVADYVQVRNEFITHRPTYMLAVVDQVVWPNLRVEIEVTAAVAPAPVPSSEGKPVSGNAIEHVFTTWHQAVKAQDADTLAALYAPDGAIETPAAAVLSGDLGAGEVRGREAIRTFFRQNFAAREGEHVFEDWWRTGQYFTDGGLLIWEYPRRTPDGEQTDLVESMDIENGLIVRHRVYWGWNGFTKLHLAATTSAH